MSQIAESRRAGRDGLSNMSLGRDDWEVSANPADLQQKWLLSRFDMSAEVASVIAEHCYAKGTLR